MFSSPTPKPKEPSVKKLPAPVPVPPRTTATPPDVSFEQARIHFSPPPAPTSGQGIIQMMVNTRLLYTNQMNTGIRAYNATLAPGGVPNPQLLHSVLAAYRALSPRRQAYCERKGLLTEIMHEFVNTPAPGNRTYGTIIHGTNRTTQNKQQFDNAMGEDINEISSTTTGSLLLNELYNKKHNPITPYSVILYPTDLDGGIVLDSASSDHSNMTTTPAGNAANRGANMKIGIDSTQAIIGGMPRFIGVAHDMIHGLHGVNGLMATGATLMDDNTPGAAVAPGAVPGTAPAGVAPPITAQQFLQNDPFAYHVHNRNNFATPDDAAVIGFAPPGGPALAAPVGGVLPVVPGVQYPAGFQNLNQITENRIRQEHGLALRTIY